MSKYCIVLTTRPRLAAGRWGCTAQPRYHGSADLRSARTGERCCYNSVWNPRTVASWY